MHAAERICWFLAAALFEGEVGGAGYRGDGGFCSGGGGDEGCSEQSEENGGQHVVGGFDLVA